jgi:hypothetical protein
MLTLAWTDAGEAALPGGTFGITEKGSPRIRKKQRGKKKENKICKAAYPETFVSRKRGVEQKGRNGAIRY